MKTALEVTKFVYKIINISDLTDIISGGVFRINKPKDSEKEDVVINILPLDRGYHKMQNGTINVNCYARNLNGVPNIVRLDLISNKVIEILNNYDQKANNFYFEIVETHILDELQQNSLSFVNIKLKIHTK